MSERFDRTWPAVIVVFLSVACVFYFKIEPSDIIFYGLRGFFILAVLTFTVTFVCGKLAKIRPRTKPAENTEETQRKSAIYDTNTQRAREDIQNKFEEQADSYKERILKPREETKKKEKEEEYYRFLGPAWKGKGEQLGGEDDRDPDNRDVGQETRSIRHLPESVIQHVPRPEPPARKRVIKLPDEPNTSCPNAVLVSLRTPIGTLHRRRFRDSCTLQVLLDYMTTVGFHQGSYTLSMSYPRQPLVDDTDKTLVELGFSKQVTLNVEEKEGSEL